MMLTKRRFHWLFLLLIGGPAFLWANDSFQNLLSEGIRLANQGQHELALEKLRQSVALQDQSASAHLALGMVALQGKKYEEAQRALETSLALDPASPSALYGLGMLYEKFGQWSQARDAWSRFITVTSDSGLREMAQRHLDRLK